MAATRRAGERRWLQRGCRRSGAAVERRPRATSSEEETDGRRRLKGDAGSVERRADLANGELNEIWSPREGRRSLVVVNPYPTKLPLFTALKTFDHVEESRNSDLLPTPTSLGTSPPPRMSLSTSIQRPLQICDTHAATDAVCLPNQSPPSFPSPDLCLSHSHSSFSLSW